MSSVDELSIESDFDYGSINMITLEDIKDGSQIHPEINSRYARLKIRDCIRQTKNEGKGSELSSKSMGKGLHKVFKYSVN